MEAFRNYLSTFITDPDLVNIVMALLVLLTAAAILKVIAFGIFKD